MRFLALLSALLLIGLAQSPARASTIAYEVQPDTPGNQAAGVLGMLFETTEEIVVDRLGVFDDNSDGVVGPLTAELWSRSGNTGTAKLAVLTFNSSSPGTLVGGSRFKSLATELLLPMGQYAIVAYGFSANDRNGNKGTAAGTWVVNDGGGAIVFAGNRYGGTRGTTIGNNADTNIPGQYAAGTFSFTLPSVPLPASLPLLAAGAGLLALGRRRTDRG